MEGLGIGRLGRVRVGLGRAVVVGGLVGRGC